MSVVGRFQKFNEPHKVVIEGPLYSQEPPPALLRCIRQLSTGQLGSSRRLPARILTIMFGRAFNAAGALFAHQSGLSILNTVLVTVRWRFPLLRPRNQLRSVRPERIATISGTFLQSNLSPEINLQYFRTTGIDEGSNAEHRT